MYTVLISGLTWEETSPLSTMNEVHCMLSRSHNEQHCREKITNSSECMHVHVYFVPLG